MNNVKISILIPIHNRIDVTKEGLKSLKIAIDNVSNLNISIIVVDDGSTDGSEEWIAKYFPQVTVLKGDGNLWWSGGINVGADYALKHEKATHLLLWNNDIEPVHDYFVNLLKIIHEHPASIIGSHIYELGSNKVWSKGGRFNILTGKRSMILDRIVKSKYTYEWLPGMGTVVPTEVLDNIGYWDSINFPQYHGDFDFTIRANKAGISILCFKELKIWNNTKFSSYKGKNLKTFLLSLKGSNLQSRFNVKKDLLIYKKHCIGYLWVLQFLKKYLKYTFDTFIK